MQQTQIEVIHHFIILQNFQTINQFQTNSEFHFVVIRYFHILHKLPLSKLWINVLTFTFRLSFPAATKFYQCLPAKFCFGTRRLRIAAIVSTWSSFADREPPTSSAWSSRTTEGSWRRAPSITSSPFGTSQQFKLFLRCRDTAR